MNNRRPHRPQTLLRVRFLFQWICILAAGCSTVPCRETRDTSTIKVAKSNGSLQCGMGTTLSLADSEKELRGIKIISRNVINDGKMRVQMCGAPTGDFNVFEIPAQYVDQAESYGFQKWNEQKP